MKPRQRPSCMWPWQATSIATCMPTSVTESAASSNKFRLHINYALQYSKGSKKDICGSGVRCNGTLKAEMVGFRTLRSSKREGEVERRHLTETQDSCTRPQNSGSRTLSNPVFHNLEKPGRPASSPDPPGALTPQAVDRSLAFCVKARLAA